MSDFVALSAERLVRIAIVSLPLIIKTKSLSPGSNNRTIVFFYAEKHCFLIKGERGDEGGKENEGERERDVTVCFCTMWVNQTVPDTVVGFKSNARHGPVLLSLQSPEGAVLGQGLGMDGTLGSGSLDKGFLTFRFQVQGHDAESLGHKGERVKVLVPCDVLFSFPPPFF